MTSTAQRSATRAVALLVLCGIAAVLLVALVPWPHHDGEGADYRPSYEGLRAQVARECGVDPSSLHDMSDEGFAVFWSWTDFYGGRHRASVQTPGGAVSCGR